MKRFVMNVFKLPREKVFDYIATSPEFPDIQWTGKTREEAVTHFCAFVQQFFPKEQLEPIINEHDAT